MINMKNDTPMTAIGLLTPNRPATGENSPSLLGLHTLVFGSPGKPYGQAIAPTGNFAGFQGRPALSVQDYVPVNLPITPQLGDPHLCALVCNPESPGDILITAWPAMARAVLDSYDAMRPALLHQALAGFRLANFVLALAPAYAKAPGSTEKLDLSGYSLELERIAADDEHIYRRAPEVQALALANGYDLKARRTAPTPGMTP